MREIPNNPDAERNLLGLTLLDGHIPPAARDVATTDFYHPEHRKAWAAFLELDQDGQEIDHIAAHQIMKRDGSHLTPTELVNLTRGIVHSLNETAYVRILKECSLKRYLIKELDNQIGSLSTEPGADVIRRLKRTLDDLEVTAERTGHFRSMAEIAEEVKPALDHLYSGKSQKIPTGFTLIDEATGGGLSLSDLLLVAGVPGSGKSAFVLQMARNIASQGVPIAYVSGEMSDRENYFRLLSQASHITNLNSLTHITQQELEELKDWADELAKLPIYMDSKTHDLQSLSKSLRGMVEQNGVKVLFIDYIQLMKMFRSGKQDRYERITEASQEIKRIAMEYGIAVVEVAQFNREGAKSDRPSMHDLEGSSQLEKDTSLIFILDRDKDSNGVTLRIVKGRNAATCEIQGLYHGRRLTFEF